MKIFVAGATGVLGRRAVKDLVDAGHRVTGVARSDDKADLLRGLGAVPASADLFDPRRLREQVAGNDVVMNLATHIPAPAKAVLPGAWNENDRIRREASRNLVDAAIAGGAQRFIQESIAFAYEDCGDGWIDEDAPLDLNIELLGAIATAESQAARFTEHGGVGVALRFGQFYGHDATHTLTQLNAARKGVSTFLGAGDAYLSPIHLDDAASAVVVALDAPSGVYNIVDDDPLTRSQMDDVVASAVGKKHLRRVPGTIVKLGGKKAALLTRSQRVSNRRFKEATGWAPSYPSAREGVPAVMRLTGVVAAR